MMAFADFDLWIFDCDGVLLDSNRMKSEAFATVLHGYDPEPVAAFLAYQKTTFGMSRFRSMEEFFSKFLLRAPAEGELEGLLERFGAYCRDSYPHQPVTPGTAEVLATLAARGTPAYIASGSAQEELRAALTQIGLAPQFRDIFGSPRSKADLIGDILALEGNPAPERVLFLGDATADYRAAASHGLQFLQVEAFAADPEGMADLRAQVGFAKVASLADINF